ncbi:hypothetical protein ABCS02_28150 [Microbacterium sp. X-17]|uniref:hypothetical protein n=1 Tax=Microbacterium sp. X-17 TaxID=3144404 RepID=UPI0031F4E7D2
MSTIHANEFVSVWVDGGRPVRMIWRGTRYLVTDLPTPLYRRFDHDALKHPTERVIGWRFQGRSAADGEKRVFDVRQIADGRRELAGVYA